MRSNTNQTNSLTSRQAAERECCVSSAHNTLVCFRADLHISISLTLPFSTGCKEMFLVFQLGFTLNSRGMW